ncbi:MAG TPA: NUDIX domain-containing protein [Pseudonocardia sp.]|nr:NUDIX domain-containing protein [Pseudonocardia sp.]
MSDRYRVVPAAYVLLRRGDEVLLQLRRNTGYRDGHWATAAAGHVELGEPVHRAACREAAEELGIVIDPADLVAVTAMHRTHGNGRPIDERVDFFFECRRWAGEPRLVEPEKAADLRWFPLDALPDPVVPHERAVLDGLRTATPAPIVAFGFPGGTLTSTT